jgi:hypothetical protein
MLQRKKVYVIEALLRGSDIAVVYIRTIVALMGVAYATAISDDWDDRRPHPRQRVHAVSMTRTRK